MLGALVVAVCCFFVLALWPNELTTSSLSFLQTARQKSAMCSTSTEVLLLVSDVSYELGGTVYHVFEALLGGEDLEWLTPPRRVMRLGLLFAVLVLQATYTANLAAFFTTSNTVILGPISLDELTLARVCVPLPPQAQPVLNNILLGFTNTLVWPEEFDSWQGLNLTDPVVLANPNYDAQYAQRAAFCHERLQLEEADIWIDSISIPRCPCSRFSSIRTSVSTRISPNG